MKEILVPNDSTPQSHLLSLPTELRLHIFRYVLADLRCRQPLVAWESIHSTSRLAKDAPKQIALLLTSRWTYCDCIGMLYDTTRVELSLRGDDPDDVTRPALNNLGDMEKCNLLPKPRHLELEIIYEGSNHFAVHQTVSRLRRLRHVLDRTGNLKTVEMALFDQGSAHRVLRGLNDHVSDVDQVVEKALVFGDFTAIKGASRNSTASRAGMSATVWASLRARIEGGRSGEAEQFREIHHDDWEKRVGQQTGQ